MAKNTKIDIKIVPIFDSLEYVKKQQDFSYLPREFYNIADIKQAREFLKSYKGSAF